MASTYYNLFHLIYIFLANFEVEQAMLLSLFQRVSKLDVGVKVCFSGENYRGRNEIFKRNYFWIFKFNFLKGFE